MRKVYYSILIILFFQIHIHTLLARICTYVDLENASFEKDKTSNNYLCVKSKPDRKKVFYYNCHEEYEGEFKKIGKLDNNEKYFIVSGNYNIDNYSSWSMLIEINNNIYHINNILGWVRHDDITFIEYTNKKKTTNKKDFYPIIRKKQKNFEPFNYDKICFSNKNDINSFHKDKYNNLHVQTWVVLDNAPAFSCYKGDNEILETLKMRYRYRVVSNNHRISKNGKEWCLLSKGEGDYVEKYIGWVDYNSLMFRPFPIENIKTKIYEKVLIKEGDSNGGKALRIYSDRDLKNPEHGSGIEVRTVFYVYDYHPKTSGQPSSEETKSLLISPDNRLDIYKEKSPLLIGWIDRKKVTFWNSRLACEIPVGESMTMILENNNKQYFEPKTKPLSYNALRNPILKEFENDYLIGTFAELSQSQLGLKIGIENIMTGLEVLFVIDGTRSMTDELMETLEGVKKIANTLSAKAKKDNLQQPRFALAFYRDKANISPVKIVNNKREPASNDYCKKEVNIYPMSDINTFLYELSNQIACDSDDTPLESMYYGLEQSVKKCEFSRGSNNEPTHLRVLIHIGDQGNHGNYNISPEQIKQTFDKYSIYKYIAIDVSSSFNNNFFKSVSPIVNAMGHKKAKLISGNYNLVNAVFQELGESQKETKKLQDQIHIISRGFAGTAEGRAGVVSQEILDYAKKVIKANNIDINSYDVFQQYIEGKVSKNTRLIKYILITKTDIEKIITFLNNLIQTPDLKNKKDIWSGFLEILLGDDDNCKDYDGNDLSIEKCHDMRNGIPIKAGFMKYTIKQFVDLSTEESRKVICQAKIVREKFRMITLDKQIKIDIIDKTKCQYNTEPVLDINNDGIIVNGEIVMFNNGKYKRNARETDLQDKYFFKESTESVAWIPLKSLEIDDKN